jgi:hypothetical protein
VTGHRVRLAVAVLVATLALGACGGSTGTGSTGNGSTTTAADNGVAAKTADEILSEATAAFRAASSVRLVGRLVDADQSLELDVRLGRDVSQGSVTQKGARLEIIATGGNLYMRGKQFWVTNAPASIASQVGDRWARVPVSGLRDTLAFTNLVSLQAFADGGLKPSGTISKGERGTVDGRKAIAIKDGDGSSLWVATTGPAHPLRIGPAAATASTDSIAFRDYNAELSVTAPGDSIDFTQVTG